MMLPDLKESQIFFVYSICWWLKCSQKALVAQMYCYTCYHFFCLLYEESCNLCSI